MAPTKPVPVAEHKIERTPEYEKFIEELRAFHADRGTTFDPEPKMGNTNVDLLQLFNYIVENGGYDKVSEEKLMWRKMCENLGLMRHNAPADAYTLKQIFYKQLAAYEIKTIHKKTPPPPEILELTTAKGGSLLTRTLENYQARAKAEKDESGDDGTPSRERQANDTPSSARASRGLREAPAPRVPFYPETSSSRQTRHASGQQPGAASTPAANSPAQSAQHGHSNAATPHSQPNHQMNRDRGATNYRESYSWPAHSSASDIMNLAIHQYQLPAPQPMPLRIVDTPLNNPERFPGRHRLLRQAQAQGPTSTAALLRQTLPPSVMEGPNIYERCLLSLRSGIRSEQAFALNHLVKISYERGDKYKFSQFIGLADGLVEFALGVGNLFYNIDWTICNDPEVDEFEDGELDGINGTPDILERIARLEPKAVHDNFQPSEFTDHISMVTEAVLTIRNMVMLPENAVFMAEFPPLQDLLCILLHLPDLDVALELKHSALDIAEQITPFLLSSDHPLYRTLLAQLNSTDRGTILTALRAISRIAMNHATETNKLAGVPHSVLRNLMEWLLLNDDELLDACLDFLYQYTAIVPNLDNLIQATNIENLVAQLVRLLSHGAKRGVREYVVSDAMVRYDNEEARALDNVRSIPKDLLEELVAMEEPDRCYQWLKCFFEEDPESNITQIAVWQAYNTAFLEPLKKQGRGMINAAEFIRNISTVYQAAGAQILREVGPQGETQRFIIKGIRSRLSPLNLDGRPYSQCRWVPPPGGTPCHAWLIDARSMWDHILVDHIGEKSLDGEGNKVFRNHDGLFACHWEHCYKYPKPTQLNLFQLMAHLKMHINNELATSSPQENKSAAADAQTPSSRNKRNKGRVVEPAKVLHLAYEETASQRDERLPNAPPQAAGIPLSAVLILRNIARNIGKTEAEEAIIKKREQLQEARELGQIGSLDDSSDATEGYKERLFRLVKARLGEVFVENRVLTKDLTQLLQLLD
ncbi:hypothetical protein QBC47DRAFT_452203 [Echria macrotheca]|uniref:RSC complex subunit Rsc9 n=1 Tax=Echria macrotheca TaxID=438768 RepID=A0AAJ0F6I1_9PEZI|nr:hypothetical protein QBC47DRAFT_452203 [Echria macrotheca]